MAGRFPGARDVEELWQNLRDGVDCIYRFGDEELLAAGVEPALLRNPRYVKAGGVIDGEELFDAAFFDYAPREAELIDPQHRLFLECAHEALEKAGHHPERFRGPIGVYAGTGHPGYFLRNLAGHPALLATVGERAASLGNSLDYLTTRVSYKLNLRGPSVDLQTACSTSLVAVHLACQALQAGDCDLALAGGAELRVPQRQGYLHEEGGVESASGVCRAFDAAADGTVLGRTAEAWLDTGAYADNGPRVTATAGDAAPGPYLTSTPSPLRPFLRRALRRECWPWRSCLRGRHIRRWAGRSCASEQQR